MCCYNVPSLANKYNYMGRMCQVQAKAITLEYSRLRTHYITVYNIAILLSICT